jgi:hypothetical protein
MHVVLHPACVELAGEDRADAQLHRRMFEEAIPDHGDHCVLREIDVLSTQAQVAVDERVVECGLPILVRRSALAARRTDGRRETSGESGARQENQPGKCQPERERERKSERCGERCAASRNGADQRESREGGRDSRQFRERCSVLKRNCETDRPSHRAYTHCGDLLDRPGFRTLPSRINPRQDGQRFRFRFRFAEQLGSADRRYN